MVNKKSLEDNLQDWGTLTQNIVETIEKMQETERLGLFEETAPYGKVIRYRRLWGGDKGRYVWQYLEREGSTKGFVYDLDVKGKQRIVIHSPYKGFLDADKLLEDRGAYLRYLEEFRREHKNKNLIFWETNFEPPTACSEPIFNVVGEHLATFTCFRNLFFNVSVNEFHRTIPSNEREPYSYDNLCGKYEKGVFFLIKVLSEQKVQECESIIGPHNKIRNDSSLRRILGELAIKEKED